MKHFINIFVTIILVGLTCGLTYLINVDTTTKSPNGFSILYIPLIVFIFLWGTKLDRDY
jgi:hypothetical protein